MSAIEGNFDKLRPRNLRSTNAIPRVGYDKISLSRTIEQPRVGYVIKFLERRYETRATTPAAVIGRKFRTSVCRDSRGRFRAPKRLTVVECRESWPAGFPRK